ncbi:Forkhead box protein N4 [Nymphon striatum]|nr:Forkhead box protein N4 [Nymphon striatum]
MDHGNELYDAISDMIDCEMGPGLEDAELTALTPADLDVITDNPMGMLDAHTPPHSAGDPYGMDTDLGIPDGNISWYHQSSQPLFTVNNSDFEQTGGGLMVNPQTGNPISVSQPESVLSDNLSPSTQSSSTVYMSTPPPDNMTIPTVVSNSANPVHMTNIHRISVNNQQRSKSNNVQRKPGKELTLIDPQERKFPKPTYSYSCLIAMALKNSRSGCLPVSEIYDFMTEHFPYFKTAPNGWKNSVRHNLSLNKCFEKIVKPDTGTQRKGCLWAMNPAKITKMDEEIQKWKRKDPEAIRTSMSKPGKKRFEFHFLIYIFTTSLAAEGDTAVLFYQRLLEVLRETTMRVFPLLNQPAYNSKKELRI